VLADWSNLGKTAVLTTEASSFQKSSNRKLVANFSRFRPLLKFQNPISDEEVRSAGTPVTCRLNSESVPAVTSFHDLK
jgi:hypothetical protein